MMINKYIRTEDGFVVFPRDLMHKYVFDSVGGELISAGFIISDDGLIMCDGASSSLEVESREDDTEELHKWLGLTWKA